MSTFHIQRELLRVGLDDRINHRQVGLPLLKRSKQVCAWSTPMRVERNKQVKCFLSESMTLQGDVSVQMSLVIAKMLPPCRTTYRPSRKGEHWSDREDG